MLNPDTRVAICCYSGDQHQVADNLDMFKHHECPIVVLSPIDAPAQVLGVENRSAGPNEYIGIKCLERMREHLKILLTYRENFFLIHDADSMCLSPQLPDYLYAESDVLWCNLIQNNTPQQQAFFPPDMPRIAFQPPWFMSRKTIETLLSVDVVPNPDMLMIDYWLVQLAVKAGLKWKGFPGAFSFPTYEPFWFGAAWDAVRYRGATFAHAVKSREVCTTLRAAHKSFLNDGEHWSLPPRQSPRQRRPPQAARTRGKGARA